MSTIGIMAWLKLLVAGTAVALVASTPALAQGASGTIIEHWGAYGTGGKPFDTQTSPVSLTLPGQVKQIGSSNSTQYALLTNGQVWAWGNGTQGELGDGGTVNSYTTPVQVQFPAGVTIAYIPTDVDPYDSAFAVDTTGHVWAWGDNGGGEFCQGNANKHLTPVELSFTGVTTLAGAADHATYDSGGTIYSCGTNNYGELGDGSTTSSMTPVKVTGLDDALVTTLVAAWGDTGALLSNGDYYDWGYNGGGQVGNGGTTSVTTPFQVPLDAAVTQVAQGGSARQQRADARNADRRHPVGVGERGVLPARQRRQGQRGVAGPDHPAQGVTYVALATGGATSYGITKHGGVWAWGYNVNGEVGNGRP